MPADRAHAAELLAQLEATEVFLRVTAAQHLPYPSVLAVERRAQRRATELLASLGLSPLAGGLEGTDELLRSAVHPARAAASSSSEEPTWVTYGQPAFDEESEREDAEVGEESGLDITQPIPRRAPPEPMPIDFSDVGPEALVTLDEPLLELSDEDLLVDDAPTPRPVGPRGGQRLVYDEGESEEAVTVVGHSRPIFDEEPLGYDTPAYAAGAAETEPEDVDPVDLEPVEIEEIPDLSEDDLSLDGFEDDEVTHARGTPSPAPYTSPAAAPARAAVAAVRVGTPRQAPTPLPAFRAGEAEPRVRIAAAHAEPAGAGLTLGLEEEDEPIAVGAVEDYEEDWDAFSGDSDGGGGFRVAVQEYVDEEEEEVEEEPEALPEPPRPRPPPTPTREEIREIFAAARAAADAGDMQRGADLYSDVIDVEPDNVDAHVGRGRLYLDLGDYTRAMSDFMVAEDLAPDSPEPQIAIGDLYFARKDYRKAIEYFDAALEMSPDHAMAFCRRGISHYYRKNFAESLEDLERAQALDPEIPNIQTYIAMAKKKARR